MMPGWVVRISPVVMENGSFQLLITTMKVVSHSPPRIKKSMARNDTSLCGSHVNFLSITLIFLLKRYRRLLKIANYFPSLILLLLIFQGLLGRWTVTLQLHPVIVTSSY